MKYSLILSAAFLLLFAGCQPEQFEDLRSEPIGLKPEVIQGRWTVSKVVQVDQEAVDNGFPEEVQELDITSLYPFTDLSITFSLDNQGAPSSFVASPGNSPLFIIPDGLWELDHPVFATEILLYDPAKVKNNILTVNRITSNEMIVRVVRVEQGTGTEFLRYDYTFVKQ